MSEKVQTLHPRTCPEEEKCHIVNIMYHGDYNLCSGSENNFPQHFPDGKLCPVLQYKLGLQKQAINQT